MITQEQLKEILHYNPETGIFTWRTKAAVRIKIGDVAGFVCDTRYIRIKIKGKPYVAHRLAWLYVYGVWPKEQIDHINHDRADNRIINLREVTHQENQKNQSMRKANTSGVCGVSWEKGVRKWRARITVKGIKISLGCFADKDAAIRARKSADAKYGFHENHGQPIYRVSVLSIQTE